MTQDIHLHAPMVETPMFSDVQIQRAVLNVLRYFEIFKHPLTCVEIGQFIALSPVSPTSVQVALDNMVAQGKAWTLDGLYLSQPEFDWVPMRQDKNDRAQGMLPKAYSMGQLIGRFPFVKAVMVSGSLSKNCMPPDGDVDFFIITAPGRLWIARTILIFFKKLFLLNSHKYFCINYLIDTEHLEIEEKNLFTATECATLLPIYNKVWYERFITANRWVHQQYYPQMPLRTTESVLAESKPCFKRSCEWILSGALGKWADQKAMQFTVWFWQRKFRHFDTTHFDLALKSRRYVSKHHPLGFQDKVLNRYAELIREER